MIPCVNHGDVPSRHLTNGRLQLFFNNLGDTSLVRLRGGSHKDTLSRSTTSMYLWSTAECSDEGKPKGAANASIMMIGVGIDFFLETSLRSARGDLNVRSSATTKGEHSLFGSVFTDC